MEERAYIRVYISIRITFISPCKFETILFWGAYRNEKYYNYLMDLPKKISIDEAVGPNVSMFKDDITSF